MGVVEHLRKLFAHAALADADIERAVVAAGAPADAWREYEHLLGAGEIWLSRIEGRASRLAVWPTLDREGARVAREQLAAGYRHHLATRAEHDLSRAVAYTNSAGQTFATPEDDILFHVALHAHYHRGKVNQSLRTAGHAPAPADYIGFVRGVPAATQGDATRG